MDALRPGHAHRSSSDRLLNNYLDSQKNLSTSLLTLLSQSHSSTSSLLAYVTSSPGVLQPIRRSVRHAAFEGPLPGNLTEGSEVGSAHGGDQETAGWVAYVGSLDRFRKDLKQIHKLEEELSRVKRDREILVTRLIKTTKSRPTKSEMAAIANTYTGSNMSSRASSISVTSAGSSASKEGKRASKLADAQAELLGCEEHLRSLEVRIEQERNKVMLRGLEERFRAMEAVGRMWVTQSKKGLDDLEKAHDLPADAFELDSNPSIAPSQSASQLGFEDHHSRRGVPFQSRRPPGSITGSIIEEDETGSSDGEIPSNGLVVHENRPVPGPKNAARSSASRSTMPAKPSPLGVPSITRARPVSGGMAEFGAGNDSDSDAPKPRGRRAASDVGVAPYRPPAGRTPLRRTYSEEQNNRPPAVQRQSSDASSYHSQKKKKGFFASLSKFFKGPKKSQGRDGAESPPYGSGTQGAWSTRTNSNIKRSGSAFGRRGGGDSSSEDEGGLISVSNNRSNWSADNVGRIPAKSGVKRSSTLPVASGLIPPAPKPNRPMSAAKRNSSQSTLTGRVGAASPEPARAKTPTLRNQTPANVRPISRSNTVKSTTSTVKSSGTATKKKTRPNGSITRAAADSQQAAEGRNIMSLVDMKTPPVMPDIPKAPKSQVTPLLTLPTAPGSSIVRPSDKTPAPAIPRSNSRAATSVPTQNDDERATSPLPPSRTLHPPLKSSLRPSSPTPVAPPASGIGSVILSPPIETKPLYMPSAPGPVKLPSEPVPAPKPAPTTFIKRNQSYQSQMTDGMSVYESADEGAGGEEEGDHRHEESESEVEDYEGNGRYVEHVNQRIADLKPNASGTYIQRMPKEQSRQEEQYEASEASDDTAEPPASQNIPSRSGANSRASQRKSVRITAPDSPAVEIAHAPPPVTSSSSSSRPDVAEIDRTASPAPPNGTEKEWTSRIGQQTNDSSEEEDNTDYAKAKRSLSRSSGGFKEGKEKVKKSGSKAGRK